MTSQWQGVPESTGERWYGWAIACALMAGATLSGLSGMAASCKQIGTSWLVLSCTTTRKLRPTIPESDSSKLRIRIWLQAQTRPRSNVSASSCEISSVPMAQQRSSYLSQCEQIVLDVSHSWSTSSIFFVRFTWYFFTHKLEFRASEAEPQLTAILQLLTDC